MRTLNITNGKHFSLLFDHIILFCNGYYIGFLGRLDIKATQFTLFDNKPQIFQQLTKIVKYPITLQSSSADFGGSKVMQFDLSATFQ